MIILYVGPILGLAVVVGALYAECSACGFYFKTWRRGRRLKACPQWETLQQTRTSTSVQTGPVVRKPVSGWIMVTLGGLLFLWELILMGKAILRGSNTSFALSLFPFPVVFAFLAYGAQRLIGTRTVTCPYCKKSAKRSPNIPYYICVHCKRASIRQGDFFTPEEYLRSLPRFQDLPKL